MGNPEHHVAKSLSIESSMLGEVQVPVQAYPGACTARAVVCTPAMVLDVVENRGSAARDHLANERTFLAWVRTALGLVGLGVILERLGEGNEHAIAVVAGVGFISFGGLTLIYAVSRYLWVARNLERGLFPVAIRGPIVISFGALLVAGGALVYVLLLQ